MVDSNVLCACQSDIIVHSNLYQFDVVLAVFYYVTKARTVQHIIEQAALVLLNLTSCQYRMV
jgi:hypothetical protein